MVHLVLFLLGVAALAAGLHWLADRPGSLVIDWQDYVIETSVFRAIVMLALLVGAAIFIWSALRQIWRSPAVVGTILTQRREKRGLEALSSGIIAIGAGDRQQATRYAIQAKKALPNEPLTHLLRAQAAQLTGDRATARRVFEAMLGSPDTEQLGLRGLFLEAEREGEPDAARQFAERALALNPKLGWSVDALFDLQCKAQDWYGALDTLAVARRNGQIDKRVADRRRAVLLTAQAQGAEDTNPEQALKLALEAHALASDLVPAAAIAGRMLAARGNTPKAARILQRTWKQAPHPELATAYAHARPGDSPRDRLERMRQLVRMTPHSSEGYIALAATAIEAHDWPEARKALEPLIENRLTQRVCTQMARIEGGEHGNTGKVREWLARAINAPRDPAWTADGVVVDHWAPISPVTGALDAFQWKIPVEAIDTPQGTVLTDKVEELIGLGARAEPLLEPPALEPSSADAKVVVGPTANVPELPARQGVAGNTIETTFVTPRPSQPDGMGTPKAEEQSVSLVTGASDGTAVAKETVPRSTLGGKESQVTGAASQSVKLAPGELDFGRKSPEGTTEAEARPNNEGTSPAPQQTQTTNAKGSDIPKGETTSDRGDLKGAIGPKLFVAPLASDDPGANAAEGDESRSTIEKRVAGVRKG
jgi:HemY protein